MNLECVEKRHIFKTELYINVKGFTAIGVFCLVGCLVLFFP